MKTTLIIMAAGIGSRFGTGIKQLAKMSPNGEIIMITLFMMQKKLVLTRLYLLSEKILKKNSVL